MEPIIGDLVTCNHDLDALGKVVEWVGHYHVEVEWLRPPNSTPWRAWYDAGTVPFDYVRLLSGAPS